MSADVVPYIDPRGFAWHEYSVEFTSPEGKFSTSLWAICPEHAELQLQALKETGIMAGQILQKGSL